MWFYLSVLIMRNNIFHATTLLSIKDGEGVARVICNKKV